MDGYEFQKGTISELEETDENIAYWSTPVDTKNKSQYEWYARQKNAILCRLLDVEFTKVMQCTTTTQVWDKLKSIYEGYEKVNRDNLQNPFAQFEMIQMKEEEDIALYFLRVDETLKSITGLGGTLQEFFFYKKSWEPYLHYLIQRY